MNSKRGAIYWSVSKLIKWILLIVLLVLIIMGVVTGQLTPLFEQVGGKIDEVMLFLGIGGNVAEEGCSPIQFVDGNYNSHNKEGASGSIKVCRDACYYKLVEPKEYMGFSEFSVTKSGVGKVTNENGVTYPLDVIMPGYYVEAKKGLYDREREKYKGFLKFMDDLYESSELEISKEEFFDYMDFSPTGFFTITITPKRGFLARQKPDIVFQYDGTEWTRSVKENVRLVGEDEVYTESYESYLDGLDVFWNYNDGKKNYIFTDFDTDFKNKNFDKLELTNWLDNKSNFIDSYFDKVFRIEVEVRGANHIYYYRNGKWKQKHWYGDTTYTREEIADFIMIYNSKNYEMTWRFGMKNYDKECTLISDIPIEDKKSEEGNFKEWTNEKIKEFLDGQKNYEIFVSKLTLFLQTKEYIVDGKKVEAEMIFIDDKDRLCIVNVVSVDGAEDDYIGIYRKNKEFVFMSEFVGYVEQNYPWVYVSDKDWNDFLKIKEIYEWLYEKCRVR